MLLCLREDAVPPKENAAYDVIISRWQWLSKPYEEVRAWVAEENSRLAAQGEKKKAEAEEKERKRFEEAAVETAERHAREAKEREERKKARWMLPGSGTSSFDELETVLMQAISPNKEQTA